MVNMTTEPDLKEGFKEFLEGGLDEENKERYKLAVTAYFKAITQVADLIILRKSGLTPNNHNERFRLLEKGFPLIYKSIDNVFKTYQDTYSMPISKESCSLVKNEIKKIITNAGLSQEFKEIIAKI